MKGKAQREDLNAGIKTEYYNKGGLCVILWREGELCVRRKTAGREGEGEREGEIERQRERAREGKREGEGE